MNEKINEIVNQILISDSPGLLDSEFSIPTNGEIKPIVPLKKMKFEQEYIPQHRSIKLPDPYTYFYPLEDIVYLRRPHTLNREFEFIEL